MKFETNSYRKGILRKFILGFLVLALLAGGLALTMHLIEANSYNKGEQFGDSGDWGKVEDNNTTDSEDASEGGDENLITIGDKDLLYTDDLRTYLLIGTDATGHNTTSETDAGTGNGTTAANTTRGEMADFLLLMVINRTQDKYGFIQLNRDTMMDVPMLDENGEYIGTYPEQLCIAHWYGRTPEERNENTVFAVSNLLGGLNIDGYYAIGMEDIGAINNAIGGVLVTIDGDLTEVDPDFEDGAEVLLSDIQAEKFLRARRSVGQGTNEERMARQLQYMQSAYNRLINQIRENPNYINDVYAEVEDRIETDRSGKQLSEFAKYIGKSENMGFLKFEGETTEGETLDDGIEHAEFTVDEASMIRTLSKLIDLKED